MSVRLDSKTEEGGIIVNPHRDSNGFVWELFNYLFSRIHNQCLPATRNESADFPGEDPGFMTALRESKEWVKNPEAFVLNQAKKFGYTFKSNVLFRPTLIIGDEHIVEEYLRVEGEVVHNEMLPAMKIIFGEKTPPNLRGDELKNTRRDIIKAIQAGRGNWVSNTNEVVSRTLAEVLLTPHGEKVGVAFPDTVKMVLLEVGLLNFFGASRSDIDLDVFFQDFEQFSGGIFSIVTLEWPWTQFGQSRRAYRRMERYLGDFLTKELSRLRKQDASTSRLANADTVGGNSYVEHLSKCLDPLTYEPYSVDRLVHAGVMGIWGMVYEITAGICVAMDAMLSHPEVLENAKKDACKGMSAGPLSLENVQKNFKYIHAILKEGERSSNATCGQFRRLERDIELAGHRVKKDTIIVIEPRLLHHNPKIWKDPSKFDPERWLQRDSLNGGEITELKNVRRAHWAPGGLGVHQCPGIQSAFLAAKVILAKLLVETKFKSVPGTLEWNFLPFKIPKSSWTIQFMKLPPPIVTLARG